MTCFGWIFFLSYICTFYEAAGCTERTGLEHTVATKQKPSYADCRRTDYVSQVDLKMFFLSSQAVLQQRTTTWSSVFAQASLKRWFC